MLFVKKLSSAELLTLNDAHKNHPDFRPRIRAQILLLSNKKCTIDDIHKYSELSRQTISNTIHHWDDIGITALFDAPRCGRPKKISTSNEEKVIEMIKKSPRNLKSVIGEIQNELNVKVSKSTIKRLCKKAGLVWKRIKKSLRSLRNEELFQKSKEEIKNLLMLQKKGEANVFYFDESGFTLTPCVPYAWQPIGENIEIPCSASKRINVLGIVNHQCEFNSIMVEGTVNTEVVIACIEEFIKTIKDPSYLVIDNASMHTSKAFKEKMSSWKERGLEIIYLSPYSPELNIIEIVWRKIKYEWLPFSSYDSYQILKDNLEETLKKIGNEYKVAFT